MYTQLNKARRKWSLSLRRAAWIIPRIRDTSGVESILLIILYCYAERICETRLRFEQRSERLKLERRRRPFSSTLELTILVDRFPSLLFWAYSECDWHVASCAKHELLACSAKPLPVSTSRWKARCGSLDPECTRHSDIEYRLV